MASLLAEQSSEQTSSRRSYVRSSVVPQRVSNQLRSSRSKVCRTLIGSMLWAITGESYGGRLPPVTAHDTQPLEA